jgi:ribosomal protein L25 (general stress protein Ctc)
MSDDFRLRASDGSQPQSRMEKTDGEMPAEMVTGGERPTVRSDEFRLRASDGSQPQSRMEKTDGEMPAAMVTGGERPTVRMSVDATKNDGSLLQQSPNYAITQLLHQKHATTNDGSLLQQSQ